MGFENERRPGIRGAFDGNFGVGGLVPGKRPRTQDSGGGAGSSGQGTPAARPMFMHPEMLDCGREWLGHESGPRQVFRVNSLPDGAGELETRIEPIGEPDNAEAFSVASGPSRTVGGAVGAVQFTPRREGNYQAWLIARAADGSEARTLLKGEGYKTAECAPGEGGVTLSGHEVAMTSESPFRSVVVTNTCDGVVSVSDLEVAFGNLDDFQFYSSGLPRHLEPGQSMNIDFEFHPVSQQDECSLTMQLDTSQGVVEFMVQGETRRAFFLEEHERRIVSEMVQDRITSARLKFSLACEDAKDDLHSAAKESSFAGILVDVAMGVLIPGIGKHVLGSFVNALPNRTLPNRLGSLALGSIPNVVGALAKPAKDALRSKLLGLDAGGDKGAWLKQVRDQAIDGFDVLLDARHQATDVELLAMMATYDKKIVTRPSYYEQILKYLEQYDTDVADLGDGIMGAAGGYGSSASAQVRAAWIEHEGERRIAIGQASIGIVEGHIAHMKGEKPPVGRFLFRRWPAEVMQDLVVERESRLSGGSIRTFGLAESGATVDDWVLGNEA